MPTKLLLRGVGVCRWKQIRTERMIDRRSDGDEEYSICLENVAMNYLATLLLRLQHSKAGIFMYMAEMRTVTTLFVKLDSYCPEKHKNLLSLQVITHNVCNILVSQILICRSRVRIIIFQMHLISPFNIIPCGYGIHQPKCSCA